MTSRHGHWRAYASTSILTGDPPAIVVSSSAVNVQILWARSADEAFARGVNHLAYRAVVTEQFGSWDEADQDERFQQKWSRGGYQLIRCDGVSVGLLKVVEEPDHVFLSELQIHPDHQNRGLGAEVIARVVADATKRRLPVRLQVLLANRARRLYERLGFEVCGETETHVVMRRNP